ncbi:MAG: hypothetical protein WBG92_22855 [Thiohalocapsa sp.]
MSICGDRVSRADALKVLERWGDAKDWTTRELAEALAVDEHQNCGTVSWLRLGRLVERVGTVARLDRAQRPYRVVCYRWAGRSHVRRVPRNQESRRAAIQRPVGVIGRLSVRW